MSVIYTPAGKAREYSPLAANLYSGCNHGCKYCYCPRIFYKSLDEWKKNLSPRREVLKNFERDCKKYAGSKHPVQFSFTTDPYNKLDGDMMLTREALKLCYKYRIPVSILTKSTGVLRDLDVIKKFGDHIKIGMTLTFSSVQDSRYWEPEASLPAERLETLCTLKKHNVKTWASFEPVIIPEQSLALITECLNRRCVDLYKIGKLNNFRGLDDKIDWKSFLTSCRQKLNKKNVAVYYKIDLLRAAGENHVVKPDDGALIKPF